MMVSPFDLMRATIKVKRPGEPEYRQKPDKLDKRAKVKAARKQRRKAEGRG
jgi:hypothetical protein